MLVVAGGAAAFYLYTHANDEIRRQIEARLAEHYKALKVSVRSTQLVEGVGIRIHDLSIVDSGIEGPGAELLHVEELQLECPTDLQELAGGKPRVSRVTVRRPTLRAVRRPDGAWSAGRLLPPPHFSDHPPEVIVENGAVEIHDPSKATAGAFTVRDVNMIIAGAEQAAGAKQAARQFRGTLAGNGLRRVEFEGWFDDRAGAYSVSSKVEGLEISPDLRDSLPEPFAAKLAPLGNLRGRADLAFQVDYDRAAADPLRFDVSGRLAQGRIDDPRLPRGLTDIAAAVKLSNAGYAIDDLTARGGDGTLRMSCRQWGFAPGSPMTITAQMNQLEVDRALFGVLPPGLQTIWDHYYPSGTIDATMRFDYDGRSWRPRVSVRCLNVAFTHHKFPFRMTRGRGTIELTNESLKLAMTAYGSGYPVRLAAEVSNPLSPEPTGWFEARADKLPIDDALIGALPPKSRDVVQSLEPRGVVGIYARMWRTKPNEPMRRHLVLEADRCSIRFNKFPYPITDIRGTLEMFDNDWTFRNMAGVHETAKITAEGYLRGGDKLKSGNESSGNEAAVAGSPGADFARSPAVAAPAAIVPQPLPPSLQETELFLKFTGGDVPLEEELRGALSPNIQQAWLDMRPRGVVDLSAEVRYLPEQKKLSIGVQVTPQRDTVSIEPVRFPYRLDKLQGVWVYRDGHVDFQRCKAEHGAVKIATEGYCDFQPDGRWRTHLEKLSADRLRPDRDRELCQALPERLRKAVAELNPTGAINLRGNLDFEQTGSPGDPLRSRWDVRLGLQQGSLQCGGLLLENVCGDVSLQGGFDGKRLQSRGELALDSLSFKDYQFTRVMGPMWIDDDLILFGSWVAQRENAAAAAGAPAQTPRLLTANLFGGTLQGEGWVALGATPRYATSLKLTGADLARLARETMTGRQKLRGKLAATAVLTGSGRSLNALNGTGAVWLSEADVYELPVMVSLLKLLSIRAPDQNAFSDGSVAYRLEGEHIYFDRIVFHGDAISLRGKGEMNLQSQIDLTFYTLVGRGELDVPIVKEVFRGASQQLMAIHVRGTVLNPETTQEALPGVNQALQQIRGELESLK